MYTRSIQPIGMLFALAAALACPEVHAAELDIPHLESTVTLSKSKIVSGEPVSLRFTFTNIAEGEAVASAINPIDIYSEDRKGMLLSIEDKNGKKMPFRDVRCRPWSQTYLVHADLKPGEKRILDYPVHLHASTRLEPGVYTVSAKDFAINFGYRSPEYLESVGAGVMTTEMKRKTFSVQGLPLEVEAYSEDRLLAAYAELMEKARYALEHPPSSWVGMDFNDIPAPIRTILWAIGPEVVSYQLELVYGDQRGFYWPPATVHTWDNIAEHATLEHAKWLLGLASRLDLEKPALGYSRDYAPGLVWTLHQLHDHGSEEIRELTEGIVKQLPEEDLCPWGMVIGVMPYGKAG